MPSSYTILIGLGSNLLPEQHIPIALRELRAAFTDVRVSTVHWTKPLKGLDQPRYANGVVVAQTDLTPWEVKTTLRGIEARAGRQRAMEGSYESRTLDLDLVMYGDMPIPDLCLPDDDLVERDFVLLPAAEVLPDYRHPILGKTLGELAQELFPEPSHMLGPVDFPLTPQS